MKLPASSGLLRRGAIRASLLFISHLQEGGIAIILFIAALPDIKAFRPNRAADPELHESSLQANQVGVQIKSIGMGYHPESKSGGMTLSVVSFGFAAHLLPPTGYTLTDLPITLWQTTVDFSCV